MGTDIHCAVEVRRDGKWAAVLTPNKYFGKWEDEPEMTARYNVGGRNYDVFAILGNVRNGHGFAGCDTGDGFNYITSCRGVPEDVSKEALEALSGDHSPSWVSLRELLEFDWSQVSVHRGWVNGVEFEEWDRMKEWMPAPKAYCGGVSGPDVKHISEEEMRKRVKEVVRGRHGTKAEEDLSQECGNYYCLISWTEQYSDSAGSFWKIVIPKLMKLGREFGEENVRLVFDFDS